MELSYSIDSEEQLVWLKVSGEITAEGLIELMGRTAEDPRFEPGMCAIADYREAHGNWDYSQIQRLRDHVVQICVPREVRWAAIVKPGALAAAGHLLILISEAVGARIRMQLFDDPQRALRWVRGEDVT